MPESSAGDAALAKAASRGSREAFARLVELHKRAVYGLCLRVLRSDDQATDAAQEAFFRAYASLSSYDPGQPFAPWLLRIARNHCLDLVRRRAAGGQPLALDGASEDEGEPRREIADERSPRGDELLEQAQRARALEAGIAALPERYRQVVTLFHLQHLSYQEIAGVMEVPIGTVMTWLHRARAQLREDLSHREAIAG